jgi:transposase
MGRKAKQITLNGEQYKTLKMWEKSGKTEQRLSQRARVILLASLGKSLKEISGQTGLSQQNCGKWRLRFQERGIEGLMDESGRGRPAVIDPVKKTSVIALACSKPPEGNTTWSCRKLAKEMGLGTTTVHRILTEAQIKPHKVQYWCGRSTDPEFEEKQAAIIGLYMNPPENAVVLAVDEKSQIQALDRTQPMLPMKEGKPKRMTVTYKRNGTTCLLAALAVHEGNIEVRCVEKHTHEEFLLFLKHLYRQYPHKHLHVIVDNFSAHKHKKVTEWVNTKRRLTIHYTPTYASWLNQVEIWFSIFSRDVLKGGVWRSKKELIKQIMDYIRYYNEKKAKPFKWTYTGKPLAA